MTRSVASGIACIAAVMVLTAAPASGSSRALASTETPERLVVFELFNRSESGG